MPSEFQQFTSAAPKAAAILVADDGPESRLRIQQALEHGGHSVTCVSCGNDAIRLIRQRSFDLVITEVIMANGDGLEVIIEARKHQPTARLIAVSGGGRYLPAVECLRVAKGMGAHQTFLKPVDQAALLAAVEQLAAGRVPQMA